MLITNATIISFAVPQDCELQNRFEKSTKDIQEWAKTETARWVIYKKTVTYNVEGGVFNNEQIR